jgi:nitrite reductase/ring-hydroxylating ferredoxin subunit
MSEATQPMAKPLCALEEIPDGAAKGFCLREPGWPMLEILVARAGERVFGYVNSCPHVGSPLDWAPDQFMDPAGEYLMCATHGALFQVEDGLCISGPCPGASLIALRLAVWDKVVHLLEDPRGPAA